MADERTTLSISEDRRREIFHALVTAQDQDMDVSKSREHVAELFGVAVAQVKEIEREGLDNNWPPLE